jgi:hypothetical protein
VKPTFDAGVFLGHFCVPSGNFIQNELGDIEIESDPAGSPPFGRNLLMSRNQQIAAWSRYEVAGDCGFEI